MDDILIVGADGVIGRAVADEASYRGMRWRGTSRRSAPLEENKIHLDLNREDSIESFFPAPRVAFLCAAVTNLKLCEENFAETRRINVEQTHRLARKLATQGSALIFLSTNLVFDGTRPLVQADAAVAPQTAYGRQKAETEKILRDEFERVAIVRLTKVIHPRFPLFQSWQADLKAGRVIHPISDLVFSPIELSWVAGELLDFAHNFRPGIFQLSGDRDLSYAEAAVFLTETLGVEVSQVVPKTRAEAGVLTFAPAHTTLQYLSATPGAAVPTVTETLERVFREMSRSSS